MSVCLLAVFENHTRIGWMIARRAVFAGTTSGVKESMYRIGFVVVDRRHPIIVSAAIKCAEPSNFTLFVSVDRPVLHLATYRIGWAELNTLDYSAQLWKILPGKIAPWLKRESQWRTQMARSLIPLRMRAHRGINPKTTTMIMMCYDDDRERIRIGDYIGVGKNKIVLLLDI